MPRYFFHTADGGRVHDDEGQELADTGAARKAAIRYAGAVLHDEPDILWDGSEFRVEVTDENGAWVLTVVTLAVSAPPETSSKAS